MFLFIIFFRANVSVSLSGNKNFISSVSSRGENNKAKTYHKRGVSVFSSYKSEQVTTAGFCAILCLKEGVDNCNGFLVKDGAGGKLECALGVSPGLPGNIEIYTIQLKNKPSTTNPTTTTTTIATTTTTSLSLGKG